VNISDDVSGIVAHDVKIAPANTLIDAVSLNCSTTSSNYTAANYPTRGDASRTIPRGLTETNKAIFVCARDAAGNVTTKKYTFGGTRIINYFQGPVMGFSYSGEIGVSDADSYEDKLIDRVQARRVAINDTYNTQE